MGVDVIHRCNGQGGMMKLYRVLKKGKDVCCDDWGCEKMRKSRPIRVPIDGVFFACWIYQIKEIIIKEQHNCKSTGYWEKDRIIIFCFLHMKYDICL